MRQSKISRRSFLLGLGFLSSAAVLTACGGGSASSSEPASSSQPEEPASSASSEVPAAPILSEGDVLGCVLFVAAHGDGPAGETERKLAQAVSGFLGKQMES